jgi:hypothetical protein
MRIMRVLFAQRTIRHIHFKFCKDMVDMWLDETDISPLGLVSFYDLE